MASHLETIAAELGHSATGLDRASSMAAEADQSLRRSIEAAGRGGFAAVAANLRAAREQLEQIRSVLTSARSDVGSAATTVASAPKEIDASQLVSLLSPLIERVHTVRTSTQAVATRIPPLVRRIAASAQRNPAVTILTTCAQQVLTPVGQRLDTLHQTIGAAVTEAKAAETGE